MKTIKSQIEAVGTVTNGDLEVVIYTNEKRQPIFYKVERMGLDEVVAFLNTIGDEKTDTKVN